MKQLFTCFLFLIPFLLFASPAFGVVDPLSTPNNKFGIHLIQATPDEINPAANLVNSQGGDWGYVTLLIESKDRNHDRWQSVFNLLRQKHLIPIIRLATQPEGEYWKRPYEGEEVAWADFLDNLVWPTKNRYVVVYNEPNHATEWGNTVDATDYAKTLDKTIKALKNKSDNFFILNAGLDASAPQKMPAYEDEYQFLEQMNQAVPGIFNKLDGWSSHSYPNPGFVSSPQATGRGSIKTYSWELETLGSISLTKKLPVFITETGWKHAEGINFDKSLPNAQTVADYYKYAFENVWNDPQIVTVTPFLLSYQEAPFDHFSFKKITGEEQPGQKKVLAVEYPDYYPQYQALLALNKPKGNPVQEYKAELVRGTIYKSVVAGQQYSLELTFKNIGQAVWGEKEQIKLVSILGADNLGFEPASIPTGIRIEPGQEYPFHIKLKAPKTGKYDLVLNLASGNNQFSSAPLQFTVEVKSPVIIKIKASLKWKNNFAGRYLLDIAGVVNQTVNNIKLASDGSSDQIETNYLLPDYTYDFTLRKPFYQPKTIRQTLYSGVNLLEFGKLEPDFPSALLKPVELWKLLPFSN